MGGFDNDRVQYGCYQVFNDSYKEGGCSFKDDFGIEDSLRKVMAAMKGFMVVKFKFTPRDNSYVPMEVTYQAPP